MRKSFAWMGVGVLTLSHAVSGATIRADENNTGVIVVPPRSGHVINVYAAGDTDGSVAASGVDLIGEIGDGDAGAPGPIFTAVSFGETEVVDLGGGFITTLVRWFPEAPDSLAIDLPDPDFGGSAISAGGAVVVTGVTWLDTDKLTDLPLLNGTDPTSKTLIAKLTIDSTGFMAGETFDLRFKDGLTTSRDSLFAGSSGTSLPTNVVNSSLVIALPGDSNLDGFVALGDLGDVIDNLGTTGVWTDGNFDDDANVALGDLGIVLDNLGSSVFDLSPSSAPPAAAPVPEPGTLSMLAVAAGLGVLRRRRVARVNQR